MPLEILTLRNWSGYLSIGNKEWVRSPGAVVIIWSKATARLDGRQGCGGVEAPALTAAPPTARLPAL